MTHAIQITNGFSYSGLSKPRISVLIDGDRIAITTTNARTVDVFSINNHSGAMKQICQTSFGVLVGGGDNYMIDKTPTEKGGKILTPFPFP